LLLILYYNMNFRKMEGVKFYMGNTFGNIFRVTTFGESHGVALGVIVDGCPSGLTLSEGDFTDDMKRRRPGKKITSGRKEKDEIIILSGVFEGRTLGTPIAIIIPNTDQRPQDYDNLHNKFRRGHGDFTYAAKYGHRDHRGGGRASGRETVSRVAAGVIAKNILAELDVSVKAEISHIGGMTDMKAAEKLLLRAKTAGTSLNSGVVCKVSGVKAGIGQPVFDKLNADLSKAVMSIGGARSIRFAEGRNDGVLAGISSGKPIRFAVDFKPPSSTGKIAKKGRHDPAIAPRAAVVVEAMTAITLVDHIFRDFSSRLDKIKNFW